MHQLGRGAWLGCLVLVSWRAELNTNAGVAGTREWGVWLCVGLSGVGLALVGLSGFVSGRGSAQPNCSTWVQAGCSVVREGGPYDMMGL